MSDNRRGLMRSGSGSGGVIVVASGEFLGNTSSGRMSIDIGNKMAQTDFYVLIKAKDDSKFERNGYSMTYMAALVPREIGHYDLSGTGDRSFQSNFTVYDDNSGTLTAKNAGGLIKNGGRISNGNIAQVDWNTFAIGRTAQNPHFYIYFGHSNAQYNLPSNVTYEYEVVYFGHNPSEDIVTIS